MRGMPSLTSEAEKELVDTLSRAEIRRSMRARRRQLPLHEQARRSESLAVRVASSWLFRRSRHVAFYLPNDGELDLTPLIAKACAMKKRCYLPVLSPVYHNRLWFAPYDGRAPLVLNRFDIPEPDLNWRDMRPAWAMDLVLTPLVAFDGNGNRLGMGGGFYDRTLAYLERRKVWRKPLLLGVAHDFQKVGTLPAEAWDVPLHGVFTERAFYDFGPGRKAD